MGTAKNLPFEYGVRWADLYEALLSSDQELARSVIEFLTRRFAMSDTTGAVDEVSKFLESWVNHRERALVKEAVGLLEKRDRDLEDFLGAGFGGQTFHLRGLVIIQESDPWYPRVDFSPSSWVASLDTYGSGTVTVELRRAGVAMDTITLTSVGPTEHALTDTWGGLEDAMTAAVTGAGVACRGLVVTAYP